MNSSLWGCGSGLGLSLYILGRLGEEYSVLDLERGT